MSDSVDRVFVHALNTVKKIPRTGTSRPPPADRLKLYGLYKQSMEGDVEDVMARPIGDGAEVQAEKEKWDSWHEQRSLTRTEAKRRYITSLIETMHRYASTTPEAQELISELEYVWDQIKSNPSSSSSSPVQSMGTPHHLGESHQNYGSIEGRISRPVDNDERGYADRDSRLRVLSPVSQPDDNYRRRNYESMSEQREDEDEEDEDEEEEEDDFQEARNSPFEDEEQDDENALQRPMNGRGGERDIHNRRWRRRVGQALTKMTAEIAAVREQMEDRRNYNRRRSSLWAWLKWLVWVTIRQIFWDLALLSIALLWMRLRGDRRLETKLKKLLNGIRERLATVRYWRYLPRFLSLP